MASLTVVVVVMLTSVGVFVVASRGVGLRRAALPGAIIQALDETRFHEVSLTL